jgi:hypothetical protein
LPIHEKKKLVRTENKKKQLRAVFFFARLFSFWKEKSGDFLIFWVKIP